jgi:hypothetical protein
VPLPKAAIKKQLGSVSAWRLAETVTVLGAVLLSSVSSEL